MRLLKGSAELLDFTGYDYTSAFARTLRAAGRPLDDEQIMDRIMRSQDVPEDERLAYWSGDDDARSALLFRVGAQLWTDQKNAEPHPPLISTGCGYWLPEWRLPEAEDRERMRMMLLRAARDAARPDQPDQPQVVEPDPTPEPQKAGVHRYEALLPAAVSILILVLVIGRSL